MPFKSEAQRAKMALLVEQGKLPKSVFDKFAAETPAEKLPERIHPKNPVTPRVGFVKKAPVIK